MALSLAKFRMWLTIAIILSILIIIAFMGFGTIDHEECGVISVIAGVLVRELQNITAFYFNSDKNNHQE